MNDATEVKRVDWRKLSQRAQEYFGGDVQRIEIWKRDIDKFEIHQWPHWGGRRLVASSYGTQRNALREFNEMAREDTERYA